VGLVAVARRWQTFADAVATALGVNVWVALVLLPALYGGALRGPLAVALIFAPLAVLAIGVVRRSETVLLLGFPSALLLPLALAPETAQLHTYSPWRLALVATGLVGYLFGASVFTSFREPPPPASVRPLASAGRAVPVRWRRRFRVYGGLAILSAVVPLVLLWKIHFDPTVQEFLREKNPGRVPETLAMFDLGAIGFWVALYGVFFLGLLRAHRTGDRELQAELSLLAARSRRPRPGFGFYAGVVVAIGFMVLLVYLRR
jgi:hypothetical protein